MTPVALHQNAGQPRAVTPGSRRAPSQAAELTIGLLKGGLLAAHLALCAALFLGWIVAGVAGLATAAIAGAITLIFFVTGQGVQVIASEMVNTFGLLLVLSSYLIRVVVMGWLLALASSSSELSSALLPVPLMLGVLGTVAGWVLGVLLTSTRQRVLIFDSLWEADVDDLSRVRAGSS